MSYFQWQPYVPVAERRRQAERDDRMTPTHQSVEILRNRRCGEPERCDKDQEQRQRHHRHRQGPAVP